MRFMVIKKDAEGKSYEGSETLLVRVY